MKSYSFIWSVLDLTRTPPGLQHKEFPKFDTFSHHPCLRFHFPWNTKLMGGWNAVLGFLLPVITQFQRTKRNEPKTKEEGAVFSNQHSLTRTKKTHKFKPKNNSV